MPRGAHPQAHLLCRIEQGFQQCWDLGMEGKDSLVGGASGQVTPPSHPGTDIIRPAFSFL